jgi:hypothetical protein
MTDLFISAGVRAPTQPDKPASAAHFTHPCEICGGVGLFGYGVRMLLDQRGRWYCGAHRPGRPGADLKDSAS